MTTDQNGISGSSELAIATEPVEIRPMNGGVQALFRFPNGFGASVVNGPYTYGGTAGLWELAVIKWNGSGKYAFELTYDTDISDDVIGGLAPGEVDELLLHIKNLGEDGREPVPGTLTAEQAEAQVRRWIAAGLPEGNVFTAMNRAVIHVKLPNPSEATVWAVALGQDVESGGGVVSAGPLGRVEPLDLAGWALDVWCDLPLVSPEQRIAVREVSA